MAGNITTETKTETNTSTTEKKEDRKPLFSCNDKSVNFNLGAEINTWIPNTSDLTMDHVIKVACSLINLKIALLNSKK